MMKKFYFLTLLFSLIPLISYSSEPTNDSALEEELQFLRAETFVVTASKFMEKVTETPTTMVVVTDEDIAKRGYTNMVELFEDLPGIDIMVANGAAYSIPYTRGNRTELADRLLLFINGVNFQGLGFQNMVLSRQIPMTSIKRIEIVYGPASAIYGPDAFGGVVNIITKSPNDLTKGNHGLIAEVGGGSFNTKYTDLTYLGKYKELGISMAFRYFESDEPDYSDRPGFFSDEVISRSWRPMADRYGTYKDPTNEYGVFAKATYKDLEVGFNRFHWAQGSGPQFPLDKTLPDPQWKEFRNLAYLRFSPKISERLSITTLASFKDGDVPPDSAWAERFDVDSPGDPGFGNPDVSFGLWQFYNKQFAFSQDFLFKMSPHTIINGGVSYENNEFQKGYQINWGDWVEDTATSYGPYPNPPTLGNVKSENRYQMRNRGGYVQLKWSDSQNKLYLVPGIRYDSNSRYGDSTNPRIGLLYKFTDQWIVKTNYGEGFQYPSPRNLYGDWAGTTVNADLQPEEIASYEASLLFPLGKIRNELSLFYNAIKNTNQTGVNLPETQIEGLEYKADWHLYRLTENIHNVDIYFNYSYVKPRYKENVSSPSTGRSSKELGNIATHKANFGLGAELFHAFYLNIRNNYVGRRPAVVTSPITHTDPYLVTHLHLQVSDIFDIKGFSLSFIVNNLFDKEYYHPGVVDAGAGEDTSKESLSWYSSRLPQPGRNFLLALKAKF